ncbi:hypothetical protein PQX77_011651, partial [Marasmius sp. AFHP31]
MASITPSVPVDNLMGTQGYLELAEATVDLYRESMFALRRERTVLEGPQTVPSSLCPEQSQSSLPISIILPELLQHIFTFCFEQPLAALDETALAFTQVCRA